MMLVTCVVHFPVWHAHAGAWRDGVLSLMAWAWHPTSSRCQDFRQMHNADFVAAPLESSADVHEAARIGCDNHIRAGFLDERGLVIDHRAADPRIAHREGAAKAAAFIVSFQRKQLQILNARKKSVRLREGS